MNKPCELILFNQPFLGWKQEGNKKRKIYPTCGKPAYYRYDFSSGDPGYYCKEHGEEMAGNITDRLIPLP